MFHLVALEAAYDSGGDCQCLVDKTFVAVTGQKKKNGVFFCARVILPVI